MPRYELMYILSSAVSDDQIPDVSGQILQQVADFGGSQVQETQLGKKKLAYPIKKTRNGFYNVVNFAMETKNINQLDAKIRTQNSIIRYLIVNQDEHLERLAKDREIQAKMIRTRPQPAEETATTVTEKRKEPAPVMNAEELDKKIEEALTEDITK